MSRYIDADKAKMAIAECFLDMNDSFVESATECNAMIDLAIDKIKELPTANVVEVTSEQYDCVSRQQVRDLLHEYMNTEDFTIGHLDDCICEMPSADVKPVVRGEWIPIGEVDKDNNQQVECSHCHAGDLHAVGVEVPYCWRCGAEMRGGTNERE